MKQSLYGQHQLPWHSNSRPWTAGTYVKILNSRPPQAKFSNKKKIQLYWLGICFVIRKTWTLIAVWPLFNSLSLILTLWTLTSSSKKKMGIIVFASQHCLRDKLSNTHRVFSRALSVNVCHCYYSSFCDDDDETNP